MATSLVNFRLDNEVKAEMESVCAEIGISMTTAFTVYARSIARNKRIPFSLTSLPTPLSSEKLRVDMSDPASVDAALASALEDVAAARMVDVDDLDAYLRSKGIAV